MERKIPMKYAAKREIPLKFKNSDGTFIILPDDARQLVGYDEYDQEVYEGDTIYGGGAVHVVERVEIEPVARVILSYALREVDDF